MVMVSQKVKNIVKGGLRRDGKNFLSKGDLSVYLGG